MNIEEIKKRSDNFKNDYLPFFNNNGEMHEWNQMYKDNLYLLSIIEQAEKVITVAVKHIDGKAEKFSEREKIPVLFQLNEALQAIRGNNNCIHDYALIPPNEVVTTHYKMCTKCHDVRWGG